MEGTDLSSHRAARPLLPHGQVMRFPTDTGHLVVWWAHPFRSPHKGPGQTTQREQAEAPQKAALDIPTQSPSAGAKRCARPGDMVQKAEAPPAQPGLSSEPA